MPCAQASGVYCATSRCAPAAEPGAQRRVVAQAQERGGKRVTVARGDDESGALMLHEPARGGSDGVCGDHGNSLVEGFVYDEAPRLQEVTRGD